MHSRPHFAGAYERGPTQGVGDSCWVRNTLLSAVPLAMTVETEGHAESLSTGNRGWRKDGKSRSVILHVPDLRSTTSSGSGTIATALGY